MALSCDWSEYCDTREPMYPNLIQCGVVMPVGPPTLLCAFCMSSCADPQSVCNVQ